MVLATSVEAASVCFGTPQRGALQDGCQLPSSGSNFTAYSSVGVEAGRTYVHCSVKAAIVEAYAALAQQHPELRFVYGETGLAGGGPFPPHKTHQNGLSVDFFVPVRDAKGRSVTPPATASNRWGYDLEFDRSGRSGELRIDFDAIAAHLAALLEAAPRHGLAIDRVIFDTDLQRHLRASPLWPSLQGKVDFSTERGWWRHDEHDHVDFAYPCRPLPRR
jgi:penicillin-insensitive murein endopeptidase